MGEVSLNRCAERLGGSLCEVRTPATMNVHCHEAGDDIHPSRIDYGSSDDRQVAIRDF